jgi:hypothetical protein
LNPITAVEMKNAEITSQTARFLDTLWGFIFRSFRMSGMKHDAVFLLSVACSGGKKILRTK